MKMTKEHYELIEKGMQQFFNNHEEECRQHRISVSLERFVWDLFRVSTIECMNGIQFTCKVLYDYLNDSHITTALKRIAKNLP